MVEIPRKMLTNFRKLPVLSRAITIVGLLMVTAMVLAAIFADFLAPDDPSRIHLERVLLPPGEGGAVMGTDGLGRDILSRTLFGARISLLITGTATLVATTIGSALGMVSGYVGGKLDKAILTPLDSLYAFPGFILALFIVVSIGFGIIEIGVAVGISWVPMVYRVVRSVTLSVKELTFVEAEKMLGAGGIYILTHHIVQRCLPSIFVLMTLVTCRALLTAASLGFLGFGIPPPAPEWGTDLGTARLVLLSGHWWPTFFPAIAMVITALGFNLFGEQMNAIISPKHRTR